MADTLDGLRRLRDRPREPLHPFETFLRERGATHADAARALGVTARTISNVVTWRSRFPRARRESIAEALGVDPDSLFPESPEALVRARGGALDALPRTIVADPPWTPRLHANTEGRRSGKKRGPQGHYRVLTLDQIMALRPETQPRAHLWIWGINQHLDWAWSVARAWGFEPIQTVTWCKPQPGLGGFMSNTEHVLACRKGPPLRNTVGPVKGTWFVAPRGRHSEKPAAFYEMVERASPGPYLEMFARRRRPGWASFGDELG